MATKKVSAKEKTRRARQATAAQPSERVAGVILSKEGKTFTWTGYDGAVKVVYKKLSAPEKNRILAALKADPRTGEITDVDALQLAFVTAAIVSWEGIYTDDRQLCPIEPEYVADLPSPIFNQIFAANSVGVRTGDVPLPA